MSRLLFILILGGCLLPAIIFSCAPAKMTPSQARGFCMSFKGGENDGCLEANAVCDSFYAVMQKQYADAKECREACNRNRQSMYSSMGTIGCTEIASRGRSYCAQYCNTAYPSGE